VRVSKARTTPLGASIRRLSKTKEPTITRSPITSGAEVTPYSPRKSCGPAPGLRSTRPFAPKSAQGAPVFASSAISQPSRVAVKMRREQGSPAARAGSFQLETPRAIRSP
jgi:hypothetical protein